MADASAGSGSRRYWMPKRRGLAVKRSHWVIGGSDNRKASAQPNADSFRTACYAGLFHRLVQTIDGGNYYFC